MNSQSHDLTHKVLTGIDEAYWQWDLVNESIFYSAQLMKILGYEDKEQIGTSEIWERHLDTNTLNNVHLNIQQHLKGAIDRIDITIAIINNQDDKLWLHAVGKVVERIDGRASLMFGTVKDVTETKNMIAQLKKQNDRLKLAERISNSGHWRFDIKSQTLDWSAEVFRIHGLTNKAIVPTFEQAVDVLFTMLFTNNSLFISKQL